MLVDSFVAFGTRMDQCCYVIYSDTASEGSAATSIAMASKALIVKDGIESCEPINVQFKVAGIDWTNLKSTGKVFHQGGGEFSMSRFGTWALQEISSDEELATVFSDGGIVAAITWALLQEYHDITAWVSNVRDCQFSLDVKKSRKKQILKEIRSGKVARALEQRLQTLNSAKLYEKLKVKRIKIIGDADTDNKHERNDKEYRFPDDEARKNRLLEAGLIANLMKKEKYSFVSLLLKRSLKEENDEVSRLQMLIRLSLCALYLDNFSEMEGAFQQIIMLMNTVDIPGEEIELFHKEYDELFLLLLAMPCTIRAIEISFAFLEIARQIPDVPDRLDGITKVLCRICNAINLLMDVKPGACLKCEMLRYIEKINEEIVYMHNQQDCKSFVRTQCIYYAEFNLFKTNILLDKQKTDVFNMAQAVKLKRTSSCWADLPFIFERLKLHPEASKYIADDEYLASIHQICRNPALLEQKIQDPKIAHVNEILTSEFAIFEPDEDIEKSFESDNPRSAPSVSSTKPKKANTPQKSVVKRPEAQKEKEMGNEAYKKKQFQKALSHYDKAISLDPTNALLHSNKAAVYITQGRFDQARSSCLTAINLTQNSDRHDDKDVAKITARLARIEFLDKHPDIAMALYRKSFRLNFDPKVQEQMKECEERLLALRFMSSMGFPFL